MHGPEETGSLYVFNLSGELIKMQSGYTISNGIDWSPDRRWMYHVESERKIIYRHSFAGSQLGPREIFIESSRVKGSPDGLYVDREGFLWIAHWDGSCLSRWDEQGQLVDVIEVPVTRPTSLTMNLEESEIFVTSASTELGDQEGIDQGFIFHFSR